MILSSKQSISNNKIVNKSIVLSNQAYNGSIDKSKKDIGFFINF